MARWAWAGRHRGKCLVGETDVCENRGGTKRDVEKTCLLASCLDTLVSSVDLTGKAEYGRIMLPVLRWRLSVCVSPSHAIVAFIDQAAAIGKGHLSAWKTSDD